MRPILNFPVLPIAACTLLALSGCSSDSSSPAATPTAAGTTAPTEPPFSPDRFDERSASMENAFVPLAPGTTRIYEDINEDGKLERVVTTVSHGRREIDGVDSAIVVDREHIDGELVEETFDCYAEDIDGQGARTRSAVIFAS